MRVRIELPPEPPPVPPAPESPAPVAAVGVLTPPPAEPSCDLELTVGLENSVLAEHHERSGRADFHTRYLAYPVDAETFEPVLATADISIDGQPLLWFTPDQNQVVVDHVFVGDLEAVDAFALPVGSSAPIGAIEPAGLDLAPERWVELLLRARVAAAWAEGPAELCVDWRGEGQVFDAYVHGERERAPGETQRVHFLVRIDADRTISVVGLPR